MGYSDDENDPPVEIVMVGIALLMSQNVVVSNPFFDEGEIRKFISLRRSFHPLFTDACAALADLFESGDYGPSVVASAASLRQVAAMSPLQDRQALVRVTRILRGLRGLHGEGMTDMVRRLVGLSSRLEGEDTEAPEYAYDLADFFRVVTRVQSVPAPIRTILRKVVQLGSSGKSFRIRPHEDENPGAWFDMTEESREAIRQAVATAEASFQDPMEGLEPEERHRRWQEASRSLQRAQRAAGVHLAIVKTRGGVQESLEQVLKRESRLEVDGATEFLMQGLLKSIDAYARRDPKKPYGELKDTVPRDIAKVVTVLKRVRTFDTFLRVIREAADRKILPLSFTDDVMNALSTVQTNKAIRDGVPVLPLTWKPMSVEEFVQAHDTGEVEFPRDMPEEKRRELLGRVSRGISDLEGIYGKGFCGKHQKKLAFRFGGGSGFMSKAHYFTSDDPREWQPRVTFGNDYEGVLAHELSHYFEDLMAFKLEKVTDPDWVRDYEKKYGPYKGSGVLFGNNGVPMSRVVEWSKAEGPSNTMKKLKETLPEAVELIQAVVDLPDYKRWEDKLNSAHETVMYKAVQTLTGMSPYSLPKDHPYARAEDARYKSELPPELIAECERAYKSMTGGDDRKLFYYQSATEVWARMCEQYVYTKLCAVGVVNPWLTWITYDSDTYVEEKTFVEKILPIFDRLFARMGTRNLMASRVAGRFMATQGL